LQVTLNPYKFLVIQDKQGSAIISELVNYAYTASFDQKNLGKTTLRK